MPEEYVLKIGDQWDVEMPGFGKMTVSQRWKKRQTLQTSLCYFFSLCGESDDLQAEHLLKKIDE